MGQPISACARHAAARKWRLAGQRTATLKNMWPHSEEPLEYADGRRRRRHASDIDDRSYASCAFAADDALPADLPTPAVASARGPRESAALARSRHPLCQMERGSQSEASDHRRALRT